MHKKLHGALILMAIITGLALTPACSKKTTPTDTSGVAVQEQDLKAEKTREQLEQEKIEREAAERELRAQKIKFMYEDIHFAKSSHALTAEAQRILKRKAQWLQKNTDIEVIIEGHSDEEGSTEYNLSLGDRRAGAVKSFLISQGIQSPRLIAVSYGNERQIDNGMTDSARAKNRRVHFVIEE